MAKLNHSLFPCSLTLTNKQLLFIVFLSVYYCYIANKCFYFLFHEYEIIHPILKIVKILFF